MHLSRLWRRAAAARRGCQRSAGVRAGALQGDPPCAAEAQLRRLPAHRASGGAVAADRARAGRSGTARARAGLEVRRSPAAVPAERRSTPGKGSSWIARRWPTGSAIAVGLLRPLVEALGRYVMAADKLHADDTPVPVLEPGRGKTRTGRLWTYVRDDRPSGQHRSAGGAVSLLAGSQGRAPASASAGLQRRAASRCLCRLQRTVRRRAASSKRPAGRTCGASSTTSTRPRTSPIAAEALRRIGELYAIEGEIRGRLPGERARVRGARAGPSARGAQGLARAQLARVSKKSELAVAIRYALTRWVAMTRYRDDAIESGGMLATGIGTGEELILPSPAPARSARSAASLSISMRPHRHRQAQRSRPRSLLCATCSDASLTIRSTVSPSYFRGR